MYSKRSFTILQKLLLYVIVLFGLISIPACSPSSKLEGNGYLLSKNKIHTNNRHLETYDLEEYIQQKPNKRFLGLFHTGVWIYNHTQTQKTSGFKYWLHKNLGQKPVIADSSLTLQSTKQISQYLQNKGYFNNAVSYSAKKAGKRKLKFTYHINTGKAYTIGSINRHISDPAIDSIVRLTQDESLIKSGQVYDVYLFDDERDRITSNLQNHGYYLFSKEFIIFEADSSQGNHRIHLSMHINNLVHQSTSQSDSLIETPHQAFYLRNIYLLPEHHRKETTKYDTLLLPVDAQNRQSFLKYYHILSRNPLRVKPITYTRALYLHPGDRYSALVTNKSYQRLSNLKINKFVDIKFRQIPESVGYNSPRQLDAMITMTTRPTHLFTISAEGTNSAGNPGIAGNISYSNRNIFRRSEVLQFKVKGAAEVRSTTGEDQALAFALFNTVEAGSEISLRFPRFLLPVGPQRIPKYFNPQTNLQAGYTFQQRPDFTRYITNGLFGYEWNTSDRLFHLLYPIELNSVKIFTTDAFQERLDALKNAKYKEQYTDHLIIAMRYGLEFSNQLTKKNRQYSYFRLNFESAGNLVNLVSQAAKAPKIEGKYTIAKINYAQYLRADFDFRHYSETYKNHLLVSRAFLGIGLPHGNSEVLPFEKAYSAGGANSMRGWALRSLGPGAYNQDELIRFDRFGDLMLEANLEYRFPIYSYLQGALFADAGNIWLLNENLDYPGGKFQLDTFFKEIAVDTGLGFRFDFDIFVIRIDGALKLRNPAKTSGERWLSKRDNLGDIFHNVNWVFGIGYPF